MSQATSARERIDAAIAALQRLSELFLERRRQLAAEVGISEAEWRLLEEIAAETLDDKILDAQVDDGGGVQFTIAPQA